MSEIYSSVDWISALLFSGALAVTALTKKELLAAKLMICCALVLCLARWSLWAMTTDQPWYIRAVVGALFGGFFLAVMPAAFGWINGLSDSKSSPTETAKGRAKLKASVITNAGCTDCGHDATNKWTDLALGEPLQTIPEAPNAAELARRTSIVLRIGNDYLRKKGGAALMMIPRYLAPARVINAELEREGELWQVPPDPKAGEVIIKHGSVYNRPANHAAGIVAPGAHIQSMKDIHTKTNGIGIDLSDATVGSMENVTTEPAAQSAPQSDKNKP